MTIDELKIWLDIGNPKDVLKVNAKECSKGYLFVDSADGQCYLFSKDGKEKDIHSLTKISNKLFRDDQTLTKIVLPDSVTSIGYDVFCNCNRLMNVTIPDSVTNIGNVAFWNCSSIMSVTIPNGVTSIGWGTFWGCSDLTGIMIGNSVKRIGYSAFNKCDKLTSIVFKGKTKDEVKKMNNYPFGIEDVSVIKCEA